MATSALIAFLLVALAELGDKSQLLLVAFAARYRPVKVLVGAALAVFALQAIAVALGRVVGSLVPDRVVALAAGALFIGFGIAAWRDSRGDGSQDGRGRTARFVAEFGDKTQLLSMSIAADPAAALRGLGALGAALPVPETGSAGAAIGVWLGSSLGMLAADVAAIAAGALAGARLPAHRIARFSAVVFVVFGLVTLASAFGSA